MVKTPIHNRIKSTYTSLSTLATSSVSKSLMLVNLLKIFFSDSSGMDASGLADILVKFPRWKMNWLNSPDELLSCACSADQATDSTKRWRLTISKITVYQYCLHSANIHASFYALAISAHCRYKGLHACMCIVYSFMCQPRDQKQSDTTIEK